MTEKQELYAMKLHEIKCIPAIDENNKWAVWNVLRVIGGWIYRTTLSSSSGASVHQIFIKEEDE